MSARGKKGKTSKIDWVPGTFEGIKIGISDVKLIVKLWGNPIWEGDAEEKVFSKDEDEETLLEYKNVANIEGQISVTIGKKTGVVKAIAVYPDSKPSFEDIVLKYGENFLLRDSDEGICNTEKIQENKKLEPNSMKQPIFLVYPTKGMYVSIDGNKVNHYGYLAKCPN